MVARGFIRDGAVRALRGRRRSTRIGVKAGGPDAVARSLSGGNLQKFIVGREIRQQPKVMIAAQPTWGVDVGAAAQIRQALLDLRDAGVGGARRVGGAGRAVRDLRPPRGDRAGPAVRRRSRLRETNAEEIGMLMTGRSSRRRAGAPSLAAREPTHDALKLEARPEPSRLAGWLSPLLAAAATLVVGFVLFTALGKDPWQAFHVFFIKPVDDAVRRRRAAAQGDAADAVRGRPRRRLSRQRLEHRRRRPAHDGRDLRRRRRARVPGVDVAAACCR